MLSNADGCTLARKGSAEPDATDDEDTYEDAVGVRESSTTIYYEAIGEIPSDIDDCGSIGSISTESLFDTDEVIEEDESSGQSAATSLESLSFRAGAKGRMSRVADDLPVVPVPRRRVRTVNACDPTWRHAWHGGPVMAAAVTTPTPKKRYGMYITEDALRATGHF